MKKSFFVSLLCVVGLVSCIDWQAKYQSKLEEAASLVLEKYHFIKDVYNDTEKNIDSKTYDNVDVVDIATLTMILASLPEEEDSSSLFFYDFFSKPLTDLSNVLFVHFPADEGHIIKGNRDVESYQYYTNKVVYNRSELKNTLNDFDTFFCEKIKSANYLIIAKDKILVKPKNTSDKSFDGGCVLCELKIYNLKEQKELETYSVSALNSSSVFTYSEQDLISDLYKQLERNMMRTLRGKVYNFKHYRLTK